MNHIEKNILIIDFMEYPKIESSQDGITYKESELYEIVFDQEDGCSGREHDWLKVSEFEFHKSWKHLRPVAGKIIDISMDGRAGSRHAWAQVGSFKYCVTWRVNLDKVYENVVDFIVEYNKTKDNS